MSGAECTVCVEKLPNWVDQQRASASIVRRWTPDSFKARAQSTYPPIEVAWKNEALKDRLFAVLRSDPHAVEATYPISNEFFDKESIRAAEKAAGSDLSGFYAVCGGGTMPLWLFSVLQKRSKSLNTAVMVDVNPNALLNMNGLINARNENERSPVFYVKGNISSYQSFELGDAVDRGYGLVLAKDERGRNVYLPEIIKHEHPEGTKVVLDLRGMLDTLQGLNPGSQEKMAFYFSNIMELPEEKCSLSNWSPFMPPDETQMALQAVAGNRKVANGSLVFFYNCDDLMSMNIMQKEDNALRFVHSTNYAFNGQKVAFSANPDLEQGDRDKLREVMDMYGGAYFLTESKRDK